MSKLTSLLSVGLRAETSHFTKGMKGAQRDLQSFAGAFKSVRGALTLGLGGLSLAGVAYEIKGVIDDMSKIVIVGEDLNIGASALNNFGYSAKMAGVDSGALTNSLEKINLQIGDAKRKLPSAINAFKDLGISQNDIASLSTEQIIYRVSDALAKETDATKRASLAEGMFSRGYKETLGFWTLGSKGIQQNTNDLKSLGGAYTDLEAAQSRQAQKQMTRAGAAWEGLKRQAVITATPAVTGTMFEVAADLALVNRGWEKYTNAIEKAGLFTASLLEIFMEVPAKGFNLIPILPDVDVSWLEKQRKEIQSALNPEEKKQGPKSDIKKFDFMQSGFSHLLDIEGNKKAGDELAKEMDKLKKEGASIFTEMQTPAEKYTATVDKLKTLLSQGAIEQETFNRAMKEASNTFSESTIDKDFEALQKEAESMAEALATPQEKYQSELAKLDKLSGKGLLSGTNYQRAVEKARKEMDDALKPEKNLLAGEAESLYAQTRTPAEKMQAKIAKLNQMKSEGLIDQETYQRGMASAQEDALSALEKETNLEYDKSDQMAKQVDYLSAQADLLKKMYGGEGGSQTGSQGSIGIHSMSMRNPFGGVFAGGGPTNWNMGGPQWQGGQRSNDPQLSILAMLLRQIAENTGKPAMGLSLAY